MKEKGFTLIELLAVIVILAIIALIAVPIILNIIEDAKKESDERSVELYASAVKNGIAKHQLTGSEVPAGSYTLTEDKKSLINGTVTFKVEYDGDVVCTTTEIHEDGTIYLGECKVNNGKETYDYGTPGPKTYANGEEVYFDVVKGEGCTKEEYESSHGKIITYKYSEEWSDEVGDTVEVQYEYEIEDYLNSLSGYNGLKYNGIHFISEKSQELMKEKQNSCLKFYAFNDNGNDKVNLLLDHNTTVGVANTISGVAWNLSGSNKNGPEDVLTRLASDTSEWKGTETPTAYSVDQSNATSGAKYTIDYGNRKMKARLITAEEIAQITGNTNWDVLSESKNWYYFDSLTTTSSDTCKEGNTSGCKYGWLNDRTHQDCESYGCFNKSDDDGNLAVDEYWTATSSASSSQYAWSVSMGDVNNFWEVGRYLIGIRPVIEVSKSKLS